jgi:LysM repeat protein
MALTLSGCFQNAGDAIEPTPVGLTAIATRLVESPTPFVTPISTGGFVPPTIDPFLLTETAIFVPPTPGPEMITPTDLTDMPPTNPVLIESPTALPPTPTALATEGPCVHTVQPGEWLLKIARAYNVSLDDLIAANPQLQATMTVCRPGDVLRHREPWFAGRASHSAGRRASRGDHPTDGRR